MVGLRRIAEALEIADHPSDHATGFVVTGADGRFDVQVAADAAYFDDHFPGEPILPAVAQLCLLESLLGSPILQIDHLRLMRQVAPGARLQVVLTPTDRGRWSFAISDDGGTVSRGALRT